MMVHVFIQNTQTCSLMVEKVMATVFEQLVEPPILRFVTLVKITPHFIINLCRKPGYCKLSI